MWLVKKTRPIVNTHGTLYFEMKGHMHGVTIVGKRHGKTSTSYFDDRDSIAIVNPLKLHKKSVGKVCEESLK
jgi:hypothetical protein